MNIKIETKNEGELIATIYRLYELGFTCGYNQTPQLAFSNWGGFDRYPNVYVDVNNRQFEGLWYLSRVYKNVPFADIFKSDKWLNSSKVIEVKLNSDYIAQVSREGIKVGCQQFPLSVIDELVKAKTEVLNS